MQLNYSFVNLVPFTVKNTTTKNCVLFQVGLTCKSNPHTPTGPIGLKKKNKPTCQRLKVTSMLYIQSVFKTVLKALSLSYNLPFKVIMK